jgi:hypothetical protein
LSGKARARRPPARIRPRQAVPVASSDDVDDMPEPLDPVDLVEDDLDGDQDKSDARRSLRDLRRRREKLDGEIAAAVRQARSAGLSWHSVGLVYGLTSEGARKRWGR